MKITPENPNIHYIGRVDFSDPQGPIFSAPAVNIKVRFHGTGVAVLFDDQFRYGVNHNFYDILIDDVFVLKLGVQPGVTRYPIVSDLTNEVHTITIVKRTEANVGYGKFLGLELDGEILPFHPIAARRMIFIGDSICAGSGNEAVDGSPECSEEGWGQPYANARLSFGPILAHNLGAEYHVLAVGGLGLTRNYSFQYDVRTLPMIYDLTFLEQLDSPHWDHNRFQPDAIVIALGTNDFSPGESERPLLAQDVFVQAYLALIAKLRGYHPNAHFFCVSSPMLHDGWPDASNQFATDLLQSINKVVDALNQQGDAKVHSFFVKSINGTGCGTHPSVEQHIDTAAELEPFIAQVMGW